MMLEFVCVTRFIVTADIDGEVIGDEKREDFLTYLLVQPGNSRDNVRRCNVVRILQCWATVRTVVRIASRT